jgi:hypothetical protein
MRILHLSFTALLTLLFGAALPAAAQHNHHGGNKDHHESHHEDQGDRTRDLDHNTRSRHEGRSAHESHPDRPAQEARAWQDHHGWREHGGWGEHGTWREHRSEHWDRDHRTWGMRGGYGGWYIPRDRFSLWFGPRHYFRIGRPVIYLGYPRFVYRDYSFMLVDPWPAAWGETWYDNDDVYIDFTDGYYLYNRRHPGVSIAVSIVK